MRKASAVTALLVVIAACGGDDAATTTTSPAPTTVAPTTSAPPPTTSTTAAPTTAPATTSAPTTTTPPPTTVAPDPGRIALVYLNGELSDGLQQIEVDSGTEVTLVVETDIVDEVHVHGYDLFFDVSPGVTEFSFVADIPGIFEAELEHLGVPIVKLEVR